MILFFKALTSYFIVLFWFLFVKHVSRFRRKQLLQHDYLYSGYFSGFALISLSVGFVFSFQSLLNTKDFNSYTCSGFVSIKLISFQYNITNIRKISFRCCTIHFYILLNQRHQSSCTTSFLLHRLHHNLFPHKNELHEILRRMDK